MNVKEAHLIYFSPTRTSQQVGEAIVRGIGITNVTKTNLTLQPIPDFVIDEETLTIITVPVYGGHVAPLAMDRLKSIRGTNTPVVLVVVYGNRAYEKALMEFDFWAVQQGFKVIGGATFIGEHSYSTEKYPVAAGRPDENDLSLAEDFGKKIYDKVAAAEMPEKLYMVDVRNIKRPRQPFFPLFRFLRKVIALRRSGIPLPRTPRVEDESLCNRCSICIKSCPAGAIKKGEELCTDATECIKCCACVKNCPSKARTFETPFGILLSQCFSRPKEPKTLL